jgi:hypothetical protein
MSTGLKLAIACRKQLILLSFSAICTSQLRPGQWSGLNVHRLLSSLKILSQRQRKIVRH